MRTRVQGAVLWDGQKQTDALHTLPFCEGGAFLCLTGICAAYMALIFREKMAEDLAIIGVASSDSPWEVRQLCDSTEPLWPCS